LNHQLFIYLAFISLAELRVSYAAFILDIN